MIAKGRRKSPGKSRINNLDLKNRHSIPLASPHKMFTASFSVCGRRLAPQLATGPFRNRMVVRLMCIATPDPNRSRAIAEVPNPYASYHKSLYLPVGLAAIFCSLLHASHHGSPDNSSIRWMQDPQTPFEKKWYWLLKAMRVYGTRARVGVNADTIYRSAEEQATQNCVYDGKSASSLPGNRG